MKYLGFVVARKGSKGVKDKNFRLLNTKPLIQYSFETAKDAALIDEVHVSTDDPRIMNLASELGICAFYMRPDHLATDESSVLDVILYHLDWLKKNEKPVPQHVVLFQPTSPIRSKELVDNCIKAFEKSGRQSLIAVSHCQQHPYETFEIKDGKLIYLNKEPKRRQEYPAYYFITGSLYIAKTSYIIESRRLFDENSATFIVSNAEAVDIDNEEDFILAEFYLSRNVESQSML